MMKKEPELRCWAAPSLAWPCKAQAVGKDAKGRNACAEHGAEDRVTVLDAFVNWMEAFDNTPHLNVLLNRRVPGEVFVYRRKGNLYYAEVDGVVRYHYWDGRPSQGAYDLTVRLEDGSQERHSGAWSSAASTMNLNGFGPCVDASLAYVDDNGAEVFRRGHTFAAGAIALSLAKEAAREAKVSFMWVGGELVPVKLGGRRAEIYGCGCKKCGPECHFCRYGVKPRPPESR